MTALKSVEMTQTYNSLLLTNALVSSELTVVFLIDVVTQSQSIDLTDL